MKKFYNIYIKIEETITICLLGGIAGLIFVSAIMRYIGKPINWANDIALLLFSWLVFFGADLIMREKNLVDVDLVLQRFSLKARKFIRIASQLIIIIFLASLVRYGFPLAIESYSRKFSNMNLSYSWATISVPIGSIMLIVTSIINLRKMLHSKDGTYSKRGQES